MLLGVDTTFIIQLEIVEHVGHAVAHSYLQRQVLSRQTKLALVPQVLGEFIHIVTDAKRWERPLSTADALTKAHHWWHAKEVERIFPTAESTRLFLDWMARYRLGRKRILDTQLAATLWAAGVRSVITSNAKDYHVFEGFDLVVPHG